MNYSFNEKILIMGILNVTPDSFYNNHDVLKNNKDNLRNLYIKSDIIDIGAESTRPGAIPIEYQAELARLKTIFPFIKQFKNKIFSIDTYKPKIADYALQNGFNIINDISGARDNKMFEIALKHDCPIVINHIQGNPLNMQNNPKYKNIIDELLFYFDKKINIAMKLGIDKKNIIIDPGIGFGKKLEDNNKIIYNLSKFKTFNLPILVGVSRKSMLSFNKDNPADRLPASLGMGAIALNNGANILRVHDVYETYKMVHVISRFLKINNK